MNTLRTTLTVASLTAAAVGLAACGSSSTPPAASPAASSTTSASASAAPSTTAPSTAAPSTTAPSTSAPVAAASSLDAANQSSNGKSVVVASVNLNAAGKGGWITLHADAGGKPGPAKYYVAIPSGASTNVSIPTPGGIPTGSYWPMLHVDDHTLGTYEFPKVAGADLPVMANGMVVMKEITVTVK